MQIEEGRSSRSDAIWVRALAETFVFENEECVGMERMTKKMVIDLCDPGHGRVKMWTMMRSSPTYQTL